MSLGEHLFLYAKATKSGINAFTWLKMLRATQAIARRRGGPAITSWDRKVLTVTSLDRVLHYCPMELFKNKEEFLFEIKLDNGICERFLVYHLLR